MTLSPLLAASPAAAAATRLHLPAPVVHTLTQRQLTGAADGPLGQALHELDHAAQGQRAGLRVALLHACQDPADILPWLLERAADASTAPLLAPLARQLGAHGLAGEMDDLALSTGHPVTTDRLRRWLLQTDPDLEARREHAHDRLTLAVLESGCAGKVTSRVKSLSSLYRKTLAAKRPLSSATDLVGARAILADEQSCYQVAQRLREGGGVLAERDYIRAPRAGSYRSLHLRMRDRWGRPAEVQLRSWAMHAEAELGPAAHWLYKELRPSRVVLAGGGVPAVSASLPWWGELVALGLARHDPAGYRAALLTAR